MIRMIAFSLLCMIAFHVYYLVRGQLQKMLQEGGMEEAESNSEECGTLTKNPYTGKYYVR